jgi:hypothetical protein
MNSSVKFFEPTRTVTLALSGLLLMSFAPLLELVVLSLLSSPPQADTSIAIARNAIVATSARANLRFMGRRAYCLRARGDTAR